MADAGLSEDASAGSYRLSEHSKFKHAGLDGKDPGADFDEIERETKGVL
jgi:hypothetical protein